CYSRERYAWRKNAVAHYTRSCAWRRDAFDAALRVTGRKLKGQVMHPQPSGSRYITVNNYDRTAHQHAMKTMPRAFPRLTGLRQRPAAALRLCLALSLLAPIMGSAGKAQAVDEITFPQTGFTLSDAHGSLSYWRAHGGLPQC